MCGIAGILKFKGPPLTKEDIIPLKKMGNRLRFRGPDDEKIYQDDGTAFFIFRRLSIIDLSHGQQPFSDPSGNITCMVNGEIYNYKDIKKNLTDEYPYKSNSDCEVVLPLYIKYRKHFVKNLRGMFAIALWDKSKETLLLARDHFGIKPLFYTITTKGHFLFASEIKSILAHPDAPREFDWASSLIRRDQSNFILDEPLTSGFKNIFYLPAGSTLSVDQKNKTLKKQRWWQLNFPSKEEDENDTRSLEEVVQGYHDLLQESVRMQLMSDVEVAIAFSGGIDSVAIAALAAQIAPIKTFTVLNLSTFLNGDGPSAHTTAKYLGVSNDQLYVPWQTNEINYDLLKKVIYACEMSVDAGHLFKYILYAKIKEMHPQVKTLLIGQGSDEFNGGYCHEWIRGYYSSLSEKEHNWELFSEIMSTQNKLGHLFSSKPHLVEFASFLDKNFTSSFVTYGDLDPWQYYQSYHLRTIAEYNLWHEDRTSSANQLENRVPFLDHHLVEYAAKVPKRFRQELFWEKKILRQAIAPYLTKEIFERPKVPFWRGASERYTHRMIYNLFCQKNYEFLNEALLENPHVKGILNLPFIRKFFNEISSRPSYEGIEEFTRLASMGLLAKWAKENQEVFKNKDEIINLQWISTDKWDNEHESILKMMGSSEGKIHGQTILKLAPSIQLLRNKNETKFFIVEDDTILFTLDVEKKWISLQCLLEVDGLRSLDNILGQLEGKLSDVLYDFEDWVENGILEVQ